MFSPAPLDHEKAETLASPQNRTAGKKYYAVHVNAVIGQYTALERQDPKAAKLLKEEALESVAMTQLVRSCAALSLRV